MLVYRLMVVCTVVLGRMVRAARAVRAVARRSFLRVMVVVVVVKVAMRHTPPLEAGAGVGAILLPSGGVVCWALPF